jgi:LmbE family N-acetylglucosaminyl deacetylase
MKYRSKNAELFIPDGESEGTAFRRTTVMGIGAHQDDIEILAFPGIWQCINTKDQSFTAVVCTDGAGSPRAGRYANYTNEQMQEVRWQEQRSAAEKGRYSAAVQLKYSSSQIKDPAGMDVCADLQDLLLACRPKAVFTHNLADKHDTHAAVAEKVIKALRALPEKDRPEKVYGVEVWRSLDWFPDSAKVVFDVTGGEKLAAELLAIFDSQIAGGKRYDLATLGRWKANATYGSSHAVDTSESAVFAMDLTPLIKDDKLTSSEYVSRFIDDFRGDVTGRLNKFRVE